MPPAQADDRQPSVNGLLRDRNLQLIFAVSLMAVLGVGSVTPAFPQLAKALKVPAQNIGLLITVFTLPTVILGPAIGIFADRLGRKKILVPSLILFGIAGAACAFVRDFNLLVFLRLLQGIGVAPLVSLGVTLIGDLYTGGQRATAMGYNASVSSVGTAMYPTIGGALAVMGWYYPFLLPLLAIPIAFLVFFFLKNPEPKSDRTLKAYLKNALKILRNRQLFGLFFASAANFIILYGAYITYVPVLINNSFQASSFTIGLLLSSVSVAIIITASQLGRLARRFSETKLIRASFVFYAVALFIIPLIHHLWLLLLPALLIGIGLGIGFPSTQTLLTALAPKEYLATVVSVNGTFYGLGQTLGPVLMGLAFGIGGISGVFYFGVGFAIATFMIFMYCTCM